jgi:hypothetical protein
MALMAGLGRMVGGIGSKRGLLAAVGISAGATGFLKEAAGGAVDASMDVAFGSPDADKYFVGRELNSRYLIGSAIGGLPMGGIAGGMLQATDPGALFTFSGGNNVPGAAATMGGFAVGAAGGGAFGAKLGAKFGKSVRAKIGGALIGGITGGTALGSIPLGATANMLRDNRAFFGETAYGRSTSSNTAAGLNAVGDIVLGMHNARGGY